MLVKWKKRNPPKGANGNGIYLTALLVEPYQDNGSVRNRLIEHLGTIGEKFLASNVSNMRQFHQGLFWSTVDKKLDRLGLDSQQRNRIEADIARTVARPDADWALWGVTCIPRFDA